MGTFSIWHWLVVLLVILLLFGSGKISSLMGDLAKGIKSFRQNMREDETKDASMAADAQPPPRQSNRSGAPWRPFTSPSAPPMPMSS
jgi:sec-independent protein translocase protein TatA